MTKVATLVEERNESAIAWRGEVCKKFDKQNEKSDKQTEKIDELAEKIDKLPCPQREEITKGVRKDLDKVWLFITSIIIAIVGSWIGMMLKK
jgi:hypothetical protein